MSDAHSWQRMLKTQSVLRIVTSRCRLFKNIGKNSPVHQVLSSTLCSIPALTLFSSFNYVSNPGADDQPCRHSEVHLWADWRHTTEFCTTLGCEEIFTLYFVFLYRCCEILKPGPKPDNKGKYYLVVESHGCQKKKQTCNCCNTLCLDTVKVFLKMHSVDLQGVFTSPSVSLERPCVCLITYGKIAVQDPDKKYFERIFELKQE